MGVLGGQRVLGPVSSQAGGESIPSAGGGGSVTINSNVDGYLVKATGVSNTLTGISNLNYDGSTFTANTDLYVSGSSNSFFMNGTNVAGVRRKFRIDITAGILQIIEIEGS